VDALLGQVVFTAGATPYSWRDVVLAAHLWGEWADLEAAARQGLACWERVEADGDEPSPDDVAREADAFRYARDLLSAEDMEAWLDRWGLDTEAWTDWVTRSVLRQRWADRLAEITAAHPVDGDEVAAVLHEEAVCSGALGRWAERLATRAAAFEQEREAGGADALDDDAARHAVETAAAASAAALPETSLEDRRARLADLARVERAFQRFRRSALTPETVAHEIRAHRLEWVRLDCRYLRLSDEQMAREAALCVREDGADLATVGAEANAPVRQGRLYLDVVEAPLRERLVGARPGELVGPVASEGAFLLFEIQDKVAPSIDDPAVRQRAEAAALGGRIGREVTDRVHWHVQL
jgi:hypothetical protein